MAVQLKKLLPLLLFFVPLGLALGPIEVHASVISTPSNNLGLAAYWNFNESSGTTAHDVSGNGYNGTLAAAASWVAGKFGNGLSLNGTSQYVTTGYIIPAQSSSTSFTWSIWVNLGSNGCCEVIMGFRNGATWAKITPTSFEYGGGSIISYTVPTGQWVLLTVVKSGTSFTYYANAQVVGTFTSSGSVVSHTMFIGDDPGFADGPVTGTVDDARVYTRALSAQEVKALYGAGSLVQTSLSPGTLANGLIGYWPFDGKTMTSNVQDVSSQGHTGYLIGFTSTTSAETVGKIGQALSFNGSNQYIALPTLPSLSNYSISFWAKPSNCGSSGEIQFFDSPSDNVGVSCKTGGVIANWAGGGSYPITGSNLWKNGTWIYITVTSQGGSNKLYINGVLNTSGTAGNSFSSGTGYIGQVNGGGRYYGGVIDDFRLYNRALSASEVTELYNLGTNTHVNTSSAAFDNGSSLGSGLVGYWTFDGKDMISNVKDDSGSGNTGYLVGFTSTTTAETIGKLGQALLFAGGASTDEVKVPNATSLNSSAITVSAWIYSTGSNPSANSERIVDKANSGTISQNGFRMQAFTATSCSSSNPEWGFQWYNGSAQLVCGPLIASTTNQWTNLVFTEDGTTAHLYSNGVLTNSLTTSYTGSNTFNFVIGNSDQVTKPFTGKIDDVRVYNRALSSSEVEQLYNLGN